MSDASLEFFFDQLVNRLADAVALRLSSKHKTEEQRDEPTMAGIAKVSAQSLARRRKANVIPFVQCGRRVLYRPAEVLAALTSAKNGGDA